MNAPLTSSTHTTSTSNYFQPSPTSSSSSSGPTSAPQPTAQQAPKRSSSQDETNPFLKDFNLIAEAAKRAQMACLMRDMEGCGL
ncbi:f55f639d-9839-466d-bd00-1d7b2e33e8ed-CDS [Sclerotinia trifoliorum]|uniref:F55f639d-9839-466d-bd00-1d7b2e33e8ed-CDS n=1 Tax=Sclerotinia trifoliorum TaxID=28548 RepID=A0A8H2VYQ9_9HELO|nr:f55f639d-9839-466d-bd00-1d7b2e33e8ed-CDS [Sclerotinia trifoliorum]